MRRVALISNERTADGVFKNPRAAIAALNEFNGSNTMKSISKKAREAAANEEPKAEEPKTEKKEEVITMNIENIERAEDYDNGNNKRSLFPLEVFQMEYPEYDDVFTRLQILNESQKADEAAGVSAEEIQRKTVDGTYLVSHEQQKNPKCPNADVFRTTAEAYDATVAAAKAEKEIRANEAEAAARAEAEAAIQAEIQAAREEAIKGVTMANAQGATMKEKLAAKKATCNCGDPNCTGESTHGGRIIDTAAATRIADINNAGGPQTNAAAAAAERELDAALAARTQAPQIQYNALWIEPDYAAYLTSKGYTVYAGSNGQPFVYAAKVNPSMIPQGAETRAYPDGTVVMLDPNGFKKAQPAQAPQISYNRLWIEPEYAAYLTSKGYTVLAGPNGQPFVYAAKVSPSMIPQGAETRAYPDGTVIMLDPNGFKQQNAAPAPKTQSAPKTTTQEKPQQKEAKPLGVSYLLNSDTFKAGPRGIKFGYAPNEQSSEPSATGLDFSKVFNTASAAGNGLCVG